MRVIIPCAGAQKRWPSSQPKQLTELAGEPILHRTVRQLEGHEVLIVGDNRFAVGGAIVVPPNLNPKLGDVDKLASSRHLWDADGWTLILFGDVWWSTAAMSAALAFPAETDQTWTAFGWMKLPNDGEIFGFAFHPSMHTDADRAIRKVSKHRRIRGGWGTYRALCGANVQSHGNYGHFIHIDDWSDDIDYPHERDAWVARYEAASEDERARHM